MTAAGRITRELYPSLRRARWRRWLICAVLVCTVGIFSIGVTHHHETLAAELQCPVCHLTAHGGPNLLKPNLTPAVGYAGWFRHLLLPTVFLVVPRRFNPKSQPRAPPIFAPSIA